MLYLIASLNVILLTYLYMPYLDDDDPRRFPTLLILMDVNFKLLCVGLVFLFWRKMQRTCYSFFIDGKIHSITPQNLWNVVLFFFIVSVCRVGSFLCSQLAWCTLFSSPLNEKRAQARSRKKWCVCWKLKWE